MYIKKKHHTRYIPVDTIRGHYDPAKFTTSTRAGIRIRDAAVCLTSKSYYTYHSNLAFDIYVCALLEASAEISLTIQVELVPEEIDSVRTSL